MERVLHIVGLVLAAGMGVLGEYQGNPHMGWFGMAAALMVNIGKIMGSKAG